jgi:hypothetical protein
MRSVDRDLVARLLREGSLSYREIARRAQCSDWSVRSIAREFTVSQPRVEQPQQEPLTPVEWGIVAGITAVFFGGIWLLGRWLPPQDGAM